MSMENHTVYLFMCCTGISDFTVNDFISVTSIFCHKKKLFHFLLQFVCGYLDFVKSALD